MTVSYKHPSVRLVGRWDTTNEKYAEATTTGAYVEFAFEGKMALAHFDTEGNREPCVHLWIQLDGGDMIESAIDSYIRVIAKDEGKHVCRIIFKSAPENDRRWYRPLHAKVSFCGFQAKKPVEIGADTRKTVEFVGDSITEGVLIDVDYCEGGEREYYWEDHNRPFEDDACATYAWLTSEALDLRPIIMGYGSVGASRIGNGKVPAAPDAYPYNFDGSPITHKADYVIINHGANDRRKSAEEFIPAYRKLLEAVRRHQPDAKIIALTPFCGAHHEAIGELVKKYNAEAGDDVIFVDSFGWIPADPLHPLRDGHEAVAKNLIPILDRIING